MAKKLPLKFQSYAIVSDAVEHGLGFGLRHLFKHDGCPKSEDQVLSHLDDVLNEVMNALDEVVDFGSG